jgi:hypothetical protein
MQAARAEARGTAHPDEGRLRERIEMSTMTYLKAVSADR